MEGSIVTIVASVACLILAGSALAGHRLGWRKIVQMGLIWLAIFVGLFLLADLLGAKLPT